MTEYKRAAKAGVIAGLVWGGIAGAAFALYIESSFSSLVNQISQQLISDPTFTGGLAPADYLNTALIESVGLDIALGAIFGVIIGIIFSSINDKFLPKLELIPKALILSFFFFVLYQISLGPYDIIDIAGAIGATVAGGYLLGYFYSRFGTREMNTYGPPSGIKSDGNLDQP
ncbi:MAG: hypothetical protein ACYCQJ_02520 [Nitrososphaerales archaeon]